MGLTLKVGEKIPLSAQLPTGATDRYVRAILRENDGTEHGSSPVNLAHEGDGLYSDDSLDMPDKIFMTVCYKVYSDSGYVNLDDDYSFGNDIIQNGAVVGGGASAAAVANAVWDEVISGHLSAGTAGQILDKIINVQIKVL